uniref:Opheline kinase n=1 Tax=Thoracophelia sp. 1 KU-2021 TaxID=2866647 RepID=A0A8D6MQ80_9ANNE|nr:opheline kinase [Thoracophelia sp. 1 KU-2021]
MQQCDSMQRYSAKENYPNYTGFKCKVAGHLTLEMYEKLYSRRTKNGVTVDKVIQPSCDNMGEIIGLIAADEESYTTFGELFDAVINEKHGGFGPNDKHPQPDLDASKLVGGNFEGKYIKSCRIRTGRSLRGCCFPPALCRAERREVEKVMVAALQGLSGNLAGKYFPLTGMTKAEEQALIDDHFLFQKPTGHLMQNSSSARDWPDARGIFHNNEKTFLIWINEEDHYRVISMEKGGNVRSVFERFSRGLQEIEGLMKKAGREFMLSDRLGYLCACPSNIGTGLRASVHIQLHKLCKHPKFEAIITALSLQMRGTGGEHTAAVDDVYDISNRARLKCTEREFVQLLIDGVTKLIEMETTLEAGKPIDSLLPPGV